MLNRGHAEFIDQARERAVSAGQGHLRTADPKVRGTPWLVFLKVCLLERDVAAPIAGHGFTIALGYTSKARSRETVHPDSVVDEIREIRMKRADTLDENGGA